VTKNDKIAEYEIELATADNKFVEVVIDPREGIEGREERERREEGLASFSEGTKQPGFALA